MSKSTRWRYGPSSSSSSILLPCEEPKKPLEKKSSSASAIPQELVVEILRRLPLESLHRFKWASRLGWYPLITREALPRLVPRPPLLGFFDEVSKFHSLTQQQQPPPPFDPTLRSLHPESCLRRSIADSCNGLLLFSGFWGPGRSSAFYLVCNPFTGSWTEIPALDNQAITGNFDTFRSRIFYERPTHCILDFDPCASSPYYNLVTILFSSATEPTHPVSLRVYNSATGRWWRRDFRDMPTFARNRQSHAVWDGAAYILCYRGGCYEDEPFQIARFGGLHGQTAAADGTNDDASLEFINFPRGFRMHVPPNGICIGTSGGKLFLANLDRVLLQLRVWSLLALPLHDDDARGKKYEWVLEHEITLVALSGGGGGGCGRQWDWTKLYVVGFHPVTEAIFILHDRVLYMYDLQSARLDEQFRVSEWSYLTSSLFPFSSCSLDLLENRNQHQQ